MSVLFFLKIGDYEVSGSVDLGEGVVEYSCIVEWNEEFFWGDVIVVILCDYDWDK